MSHSSPQHRSAPIAIRRRGSATPRELDSDDEGELLTDLEDALRLTTMVGSVPTKPRGFVTKHTNRTISSSMPAAPKLSYSRPPSLAATDAVPPFRLSSSQADAPISYGSLRESHLEGRFLDGPSSFRDRGSGEIRRFTGPSSLLASTMTTTISTAAGIQTSLQTPGERMQSAVPSSAATPEKKSMLGDMMKDDATEHRSNATTGGFVPIMKPTIHDYRPDEVACNMLSTSLTGLELLARGDLMNRATPDPTIPNATMGRTGTPINFLSSPVRSLESREHDEASWYDNSDTEEVFDLDME